MSTEDLKELFDKWNPMRAAYINPEFNKYTTGPGAALHSSLLTAKKLNKEQLPYLYISNVPSSMDRDGLYNLCSRYGRVMSVRKHDQNYFMDIANIADMEAIHRSLKDQFEEINVQIGNRVKQTKQVFEDKVELEQSISTVEMDNDQTENKLESPSSRTFEQPIITEKPLVTVEDYESKNNLLKAYDPQKHYLMLEDSYNLERLGYVENSKFLEKSSFKFQSGRSFIELNDSLESAKFVSELSSEEQIEKFGKTGTCDFCNALCYMKCTRCATFYCSRVCQMAAWGKHRYVCGKPKHMQITPADEDGDASQTCMSTSSISSLSTKSSQEDKMPENGSFVMITSISKTNLVFIRSMQADDCIHFFKIMHQIQMEASSFQKLHEIPTLGQIVIVKFKEQFNRAMILNTDNPDSIKLIYIDFGNIEHKKMSDLYITPTKFLNISRLAIPVLLKGVPNRFMTTSVRDFMYEWLNKNAIIQYDSKEQENGIQCVQLIDPTDNQIVNNHIIRLCNPYQPSNSKNVFYINFIKHAELPLGDNIELLVMDNSFLLTSCISCTTRDYAIEITKFQKEIQAYAAPLINMHYAPRVNELCIAKYRDQKWYRGHCIELLGNGKPSIMFIDYGFSARISIYDIRPYPPQYTFPKLTVECDIKDAPMGDNKSVELLEKLLPIGSTILCDRVEFNDDDNVYTITINNIMEQLKNALQNN